MTTQETTQATSVAAGTQSSASSRTETGDPDLFAQTLESQLTSAASFQERVAASLEKLASAFPGATITTQDISTSSGAGSFFYGTGQETSISITEDMAAQMANDADMFEKVKQLLGSMFSAGSEQNLVNAGGGATQRNVSIEDGAVRYVEVQRSSSGTQMSVSRLSIESQQVVDDTLNQLLASRNSGSLSGSPSSSKSASTGFESLVGGSSNWRLQSFVSNQSLVGMTSAGTNLGVGTTGIQNLVSQTQTQTLEVALQQWSVSSSTANAGGFDLLAYIQLMGLSDPLVLDLGGEGINLSSPEDGVMFDIKGDGSPVKTSWISGNNAFLYLDENGNGLVDDANELFGDAGGYANGYAKLARYDDNGDGVIDELDSIYNSLRLWRDLNGDGVNQEEESLSLAQAGIGSINLRHDGSSEIDQYGNVISDRSSFTRVDGTSGAMAEVWLRNL